jgi:hypothetical protein
MTEAQKATARRMFVFENKSEQQISEALAVPLPEVMRFVNGGDQWKPRKRLTPERVSTATVDRLESLVSGLSLAGPRRRRQRGPMGRFA